MNKLEIKNTKKDKIETALSNLDKNFIIFGVKTGVSVNSISEIRKLVKFTGLKKNLISRALEKKNIRFNIKNITLKKENIFVVNSNNLIDSVGALLKKNVSLGKIITLYFCSINNNKQFSVEECNIEYIEKIAKLCSKVENKKQLIISILLNVIKQNKN